MDPNYAYQPWMQQHMQPQHHPPPGTPGSTISALPMSPRVPQQPLHTPGTPTLIPAVPPNAYPPHTVLSPHTHTVSLSSVSSSAPSTPSTSTTPGGVLSRLSSNVNTFTPKRVVIKSETGQEVNLEQYKKHLVAVSLHTVLNSPARRMVQVRMETGEAKKRRIAEEAAKQRERGGGEGQAWGREGQA